MRSSNRSIHADALTRRVRAPAAVVAIAWALVAGTVTGTRPVSDGTGAAGALSIAGTRLAVDGQAAFLVGVSLFDALGSVPPRDQDLDALKRWGVSLVRVWAHWREPVYGPDGTLHENGRERLERLAGRLRARGLALELVLLRPGQLPGQRFAGFDGPAARVRAVTEIARALAPYRNVLFDLYNEHDHPHGPISHRDARALRDAVKRVDPDRLVTISSTEYHLVDARGALNARGRRNLEEEAGLATDAVGVDLLAAHLPRTVDWAEATAARVGTLRHALGEMGRALPVLLSEERRARAEEPPIPAEAYLRAASGALAAGAATWTFHTAAGFAFRERPFLEALGPTERDALHEIGPRLRTGPGRP